MGSFPTRSPLVCRPDEETTTALDVCVSTDRCQRNAQECRCRGAAAENAGQWTALARAVPARRGRVVGRADQRARRLEPVRAVAAPGQVARRRTGRDAARGADDLLSALERSGRADTCDALRYLLRCRRQA